ncbi:hypothetical protein ACET3X_005259 [Alternaria dauci]|uniref:DNA/RNA-binding domain-containing protein n=1 Tax=Alternaria dauci TaxID=48095 RepID=A0ABR3UK67_9PLEO
MDTGQLVQSKFAQALKNQSTVARSHPCPYPGHEGRIFPNAEQLYDHGRIDHRADFEGLTSREARDKFRELSTKFRRSDHSSDATAGDRSALDIGGLTINPGKDSRQNSPPSGRKRPAEHEFTSPRGKGPSHVEIVDPEYSRQIPHTVVSDRTRPKQQDARLFDPKQSTRGTPSPYQTTPEPSSEWSVEATKSNPIQSSQSQSPARSTQRSIPKTQHSQRQPGLIELQRYDPRYPGLLLQPDSRPISQEQLASEVKSIYAGLTMVETKCIHVDRAQAAAAQDSDTKLASDHWQALIALHRTLLHEHHDFFLASQHPSASPALRRLAAKYSMPARMWKHGIHSFLELLRRRLPDSIDYMLAFIYLAYQMMALLYETVPAFEDTWIECLGDLGRYRMAIEDEDVRDRETWAGVARSWYTKAADKNPTVGRLYHHLAILARPNALQQMYYYSRSLTCVKPFQSARESILTLLDPILGRAGATSTHALAIDTSFIRAHGLQFNEYSVPEEKRRQSPSAEFTNAKTEFIGNLDNHIGRVTAKWKEQGVYIAVTNIAGWFAYGQDDNTLRRAFLTQILEKADEPLQSVIEDKIRTAATVDQQYPAGLPRTKEELEDFKDEVKVFSDEQTFVNATTLSNDTFALVLRRIGDKNVLPHVHIMLAFFASFASNHYVQIILDGMPWAEVVAFLNTLVKTENQVQSQTQNQPPNIDTLFATGLFPAQGERKDELPLPEDYLVRGLIWTQSYFPQTWFEREHDEEERYLELASTVKNRMDRVLRLGYTLSQYNKWISYDKNAHTFAVVGAPAQ